MAFKLAWALCQRACQAKRVTDAMRTFLLQAVGLAALGTVADVVPLVDENRILVRHGLHSLRQRPTLGMAALMKLIQARSKTGAGVRRYRLHAGPAAERRRPVGPGAVGRRIADHRIRRAGRRAGRIPARAQQQPRQLGTQHLSGRQQAGAGRIRSASTMPRWCWPIAAGIRA